ASKPSSRAMVNTEFWVMPSSAPADVGGVMILPLRTTKMFSPVHSLTYPCGDRMIASSYPALSASTLAIEELMYMPVPLAAGGMALGSWRCHELTFMRTPFWMPSSPRYAPHGHTAIDTLTWHGSGFRPISPYPRYTSGRM